jgi:hypothetical protein
VTTGQNGRTPEQIRREIESERDALARAVDDLRGGFDGTVRARLPVLAGGALATGFVLAGGIGATMRLLARRGRESRTKVSFGPFSLIERG